MNSLPSTPCACEEGALQSPGTHSAMLWPCSLLNPWHLWDLPSKRLALSCRDTFPERCAADIYRFGGVKER